MALDPAIVEERLKNITDQLNRLIAHFESEQRHTVNHGNSIDRQEKWLDRLEKANDKHEKILFNGGEGIIRRVDRIIHAELMKKESDKHFQWTFSNIIAVASLISSIILGWLVLNH